MYILVICVEQIRKIFYGQCNSAIGLCVYMRVCMCMYAYVCMPMYELYVLRVSVCLHMYAFACTVLSMICYMCEFSCPLSAVC